MADPTLTMFGADTLAIIGTVIGTGGFLAVMAWRMANRLDRRIDADKAAADADRRAFLQRADADRRAFQASMDDFRKEMLRLAERQSHVEGQARPAE